MRKIHLFQFENMYFLLNADTLEIYEIDEDTFRELVAYTNLQNYSLSSDLQNALIDEGILLKNSEYEHEIQEASQISNSRNSNLSFRSLLLGISNICNMNCEYCYGLGGDYGRESKMMDLNVAKKAVDFMVDHSGDHDELFICFFGGEPLLGFDTIVKVVDYCTELSHSVNKTFRYSMTTNATLINDKMADFFKEHHFSIMVSIDGDREVNDAYRTLNDGKGSYDKIQAGINCLKKHGIRFTARATVCAPNLNLNEIYSYEKSLGATDVILTLVTVDPHSRLHIDDSQNDYILNEYKEMANSYFKAVSSGNYKERSPIRRMIEPFYIKSRRTVPCRAGLSYFAVNYQGDIFPCQRYMGDDRYILGNVFSGNFTSGKLNEFLGFNVLSKTTCNLCWARFLCAGSCHYTTTLSNDDLTGGCDDKKCSILKGIFEIAIYTYWRLKQLGPDTLDKIFDDN